MTTTIVSFETIEGKVTPDTREGLAAAIRTLSDGWHRATIEDVRRGYTSTRYKYYFGHVLHTILLTCGKRFQVLDGDTFRPVRDTTEIHNGMKMKYNPVIMQTPFGNFTVPDSSTSLTDKEFINEFEEQIIAEFSEAPFNCEFMSREEYALFMKNGGRHIVIEPA
jgi:hypothetical protein